MAANAKPDEIHPTLKSIALYLNTLAHNGVPANHRHIAAVFHQGGGDAVLANDVYKGPGHNGMDNPKHRDAPRTEAGWGRAARLGQGLLGKKLEPSQVLPGVQVDLLGDDDDGQSAAAGLRPDRWLTRN